MRFNATICLYLSPNDRARSLSTLMATIVNIETPNNTKPVIKLAWSYEWTKIPLLVNRQHKEAG